MGTVHVEITSAISFALDQAAQTLAESRRQNAALLRTVDAQRLTITTQRRALGVANESFVGYEREMAELLACCGLEPQVTGRIMAVFLCAVDERAKNRLDAVPQALPQRPEFAADAVPYVEALEDNLAAVLAQARPQ